MTSLTILGIMEILCSFRLVLEGKTGKETFLANDFPLSDAEDSSSDPLNGGGIACLSLLRTLLLLYSMCYFCVRCMTTV